MHIYHSLSGGTGEAEHFFVYNISSTRRIQDLSKLLEIRANMPGLGGAGFDRYSLANQIFNFNHGHTFHVICKVHQRSVQ